MVKKREFLLIFGLFLCLMGVYGVFAATPVAESSTFSLGKHHIGVAGGKPESSSFKGRYTTTYEQPGNGETSSSSFTTNIGWFVNEIGLGGAIISSVQCSNDSASTFVDCSQMAYGYNITHMRAECSVNSGSVSNVTFTLHNDPDNVDYIDNQSFTFKSGNFFILNSSFFVQDSGDWNLTVLCFGQRGPSSVGSDENLTFWQLAFGTLNANIIDPVGDLVTEVFGFFKVRVNVSCTGGECANTSVVLDPKSG